jgi:hypothetical protein
MRIPRNVELSQVSAIVAVAIVSKNPGTRNRHLDLRLERTPRKEGRKMTVVLLSFLLTITVRTWGIAK